MSALAMRAYVAVFTRLGDTRRGATAVEYGLLVAFVAAVCVSAVALLGGATLGLYGRLFTASGPFRR
jgi:Flp pilus assembly pilin Flp